MLNQEEYVKVLDLHRQGWTKKEIAEELGFHPATISKWLAAGGPPAPRVVRDDARVMTQRWRQRVALLLESHPRLLAVSVFNKVRAEGFGGSYPTVVREVRAIRGPRFRAAAAVSVPISTDPGEEAQFDFCDLSEWAARWGWSTRLVCFGAILCWSRQRVWWFTTSEDRHHTFEGLVRFFEAVGGVPAGCRTDRMGALGSSQGSRFRLHPPSLAFAAHHGTKITTCRARDAKRKGKVERPFRQLQETFLPEVELDGPPAGVDELNTRATAWLTERVHAVASRTTGEAPALRLEVERPFLAPLPRVRFDTDHVQSRRVHTAFPFVVVDGVRYSVPPRVLGQLVEIRRPVDAARFEIRWAGQSIATHAVAQRIGNEQVVWDPAHRRAAENDALGRQTRRHLRVVAPATSDPAPQRLVLPGGDFEVAPPDLAARYGDLGRIDEEAGA
jgi:transposase